MLADSVDQTECRRTALRTRCRRTNAQHDSNCEVNGAAITEVRDGSNSVQIPSPRLFRKIKSRRRLRKRLATGFELSRGGPATGIEHSGPGASPADVQEAAAGFPEMQKQAGAGKGS